MRYPIPYACTRLTSIIAIVPVFCTALLAANVAIADDDDDSGGWTTDKINEILSNARNASNRARDILEAIQAGREQLDDLDLAGTLSESLDDIKNQIDEMREGRSEFLGSSNSCNSSSPCGQFRADLVGLLEGVEHVNNALLLASPIAVETDFHRLIDLAENAPGRLLYPMYRVLAEELPIVNSDLTGALSELAAHVEFLATSLHPGTLGTSNVSGFDQCEFLMQDSEFTQRAIGRTQIASGTLILVGYGLIASGETHLEGKAGVHGYPGIVIKNNLRKKAGNVLAGTGKGVTALAASASDRHRYCTTLQFRADSLANQQKLLNNQQRIWDSLPPGWTRGQDELESFDNDS